MPAIATILVAIRFQIVQQLGELAMLIVTKGASPRSFNPKPDVISFHHATDAGKRQPMITKRLPMTSNHHVDRAGSHGHDLVSVIRGHRLADRREAGQPFAPKIFSFPTRR